MGYSLVEGGTTTPLAGGTAGHPSQPRALGHSDAWKTEGIQGQPSSAGDLGLGPSSTESCHRRLKKRRIARFKRYAGRRLEIASASPVSVMGDQTSWLTARVLWRSPHCTSCRQCKEAMRAVVQRCGDAKLDWITPLTRACIDGRTKCVCELLKPPEVECHTTNAAEPPWRHQWMIDFADSERHTALHAACAFGYEDCVSLLIQAGATLDMADDEGDTPLDGALMASSDSGQACADLLLAAGAAKETPLRALGHSLAVVAHCHEWAGDLTATAFPS